MKIEMVECEYKRLRYWMSMDRMTCTRCEISYGTAEVGDLVPYGATRSDKIFVLRSRQLLIQGCTIRFSPNCAVSSLSSPSSSSLIRHYSILEPTIGGSILGQQSRINFFPFFLRTNFYWVRIQHNSFFPLNRL